MKKNILYLILLIHLSSVSFSQDIHFSQFNMSPLTLNPALAGANHEIQAIINYKDQWRGVSTPYKTFGASIDSRYIPKNHENSTFAGGINFFQDRAGDSKMGISQINLTLGYHHRVAKFQTLGLALQGGYAQRSLVYNDLQWSNQYDPNSGYDPNLPSGETNLRSSFTYIDIGGGLLWNINDNSGLHHVEDNHDFQAKIGVGVYHFKQKYSFYEVSPEQLYTRYVLHGDALISVPNFHNLALLPGLVFFSQGPAKELYFGTMFRYKLSQASKYTGIKKDAAVYLGAYCRAKDAIIISFMLEYFSYTLGISYDYNLSKLTQASSARGGIELSLRYTKLKYKKATLRTERE
jgi:type IX secretion system PorP/SprF family membrane protein